MATRKTTTTKTAAIYIRVSSRSQDAQSQEPELSRWAESYDGPAKIYRDTATGTNMERPGWSNLWNDVQAGKVGTIVVWRLDRLGRTARGLTALFDDMKNLKVNLVSIRDGLNLETAAGRLMANVLASMAAFETEVRSERQMAGIAVAKSKGVKFGRPPGVRTRIKVTPEQEEQVRRLKAEGQGVSAIARATGLSRPTVYAILEPATAR